MSNIDHLYVTHPHMLFCTGSSMFPTIQPGDWIKYQPIQPTKIKPGAVVLISSPDHPQTIIVHRIIACSSNQIRTQGDGNPNPDPWVLPAHAIIGQALYIHRHRQIYRIIQGRRGLWQAYQHHAYQRLIRYLRQTGVYYYHAIARLTSTSLQHTGFKLPYRVLPIQRQEGLELQLWLDHTWIGRLPPQADDWIIKPPYRLVISSPILTQLKQAYRH